MSHLLSLLGIPVILIGLAARLNPLVVVTAAAIVTGLAGGMDVVAIVSLIGKGFNDARYISVVFLILPLIGLLERFGLQARARTLAARLAGLSPGRLLIAYLAARQLTAALGLLSLGGQATMVRPLIAPMAEAAADTGGKGGAASRDLIRAHAAAVDNIGAFFGEDIFIALGSVLLIQAVLEQNGVRAPPLAIALWAIPTALVAFAVHAARLRRLDARLGQGRAR
ncbi:MAG: DUF969 domain-containing protein [Caulobacteraceae bacterium]